jgi:hypothetical protein
VLSASKQDVSSIILLLSVSLELSDYMLNVSLVVMSQVPITPWAGHGHFSITYKVEKTSDGTLYV